MMVVQVSLLKVLVQGYWCQRMFRQILNPRVHLLFPITLWLFNRCSIKACFVIVLTTWYQIIFYVFQNGWLPTMIFIHTYNANKTWSHVLISLPPNSFPSGGRQPSDVVKRCLSRATSVLSTQQIPFICLLSRTFIWKLFLALTELAAPTCMPLFLFFTIQFQILLIPVISYPLCISPSHLHEQSSADKDS